MKCKQRQLLFVQLQSSAPLRNHAIVTLSCDCRTWRHPRYHLVEESNDLASNVLSPSLLVVHDTGGGSQDDVAELTRWKQSDDPLLQVDELDVVAWGDDTGLVETAVELDDNLAVAVVVTLLELANVA